MAVTRFGVSVPSDLIEQFDKRVRSRGYRTRSEAICDIIRDYLVQDEWQRQSGPVVGTITVVYRHGTRELTRALTEIQHRHHGSIICTTHIHLDQHNCLEVIVAKGNPTHLQTIADRLISTRGVKHGKLVCTTTGAALA